MKKWIMVLCAISLSAMLTACGGSDEKVVEKKPASVTQDESSGNTAQEEDASKVTDDEKQQETVVKGYVFKQGNVVVQIDADAAPVIDALGEPVSYFEAASCAFEGLDKMYTYNSFEIDTYPVEDKDFVSAIIFKDDSITTAEGIAIGETRDKVEAVYGTDYKEQGSMIVYEKDSMRLSFIFEGNAVVSIQYGTMVLDE